MSDSALVAHVKRSIYRAILQHLEANKMSGQRQHLLAEKLGLHQPDVSRLRAGKLDHFTVDLLLRVAERLGIEFCFDPRAEAEAARVYKGLLARCRKAKNGAESRTINACEPALKAMNSLIVTRLKSRRKLDTLLRYVNTKRNTPREDLDWLIAEIESEIAELSGQAWRRPQVGECQKSS
jgi:predicted XRE-type DNA-binding protein